jgi:AraC family transcriptional regulator of adaptative response / DNA-3-methyladenine glycosylase II
LAIAESELTFLKTPTSRKQTLRNLARLYVDLQQPDEPEQWLSLKGIGPWTVDYARLRGISDPDVYLGGDLGVKKAVEKSGTGFNPDLAAPWRSYLTFQLWNQP